MSKPEYHELLDGFYDWIGATNIQRSDVVLQSASKPTSAYDLFVDGALVDRFGAARHFHEKVMMHQWMAKYLTVTVDLPAHPYHGRRGEFWESLAHWHVCAYKNAAGDGLSAIVVCNFQALQDFVSLHANILAPDDKWVEISEARRFVRIPITVLLHHKRAANVVVTYLFDDEAMAVYRTKQLAIRMAYADRGEWSDEPLNTY